MKNCLSCGKPVKGRSDKKFCDDYCRNNYNNALKSGDAKIVRNINNILRKNRSILEMMIPAGETTVKANRQKLMGMNFNFTYFTHLYKNHKGNTYFFCYDFGYLPLENDWYLIVMRKSELNNKTPMAT